jgi:hypothetical protein
MKTGFAAVLIAVLLGASAGAQAPDVTGKWDLTVNGPQGTIPGTMAISRAGDKLVATISSQQGEVASDVELKGREITIYFSIQGQNGSVDVTMTGTVNGNEMSGNMDLGGRGSATWTATRTSAPPAQPTPQEKEKPAPTMTGTWAFEVHHSAGVSTPTITITQTGEKLAGKYVSTYGSFELTGSIKGTEFTFSVEVGTEQTVKLVYTGALSVGEMGEGTFTGKRK